MTESDVSLTPGKKTSVRKPRAAKSEKASARAASGIKKKVRVVPVGSFKIHCHTQNVLIPPTGVEVEFDSWVRRQIELGCLREL